MPMLFKFDLLAKWPDYVEAPAELLIKKPAYRFVADGVAIQSATPRLLSRVDADRLMQQLQNCRAVRFYVEDFGDTNWPAYLFAFSVRGTSISLAHYYNFRTSHECVPTAQTWACFLYDSVENALRNEEASYCYVPLTLTAPMINRVHEDGSKERVLLSPDLGQRPADGGMELYLAR